MDNNIRELIERFQTIVCVIGAGFIGLPLALEFVIAGFRVKLLDTNNEKIERLNCGMSYIDDVTDDDVVKAISTGRFSATSCTKGLAECNVFIVCVPTPLDKNKQPDLSYIISAASTIAENFQPQSLVIIESTIYPQTTNELIKPILEYGGKKCGRDFFLAYSPERIDPGNKNHKVNNIPKIIGGITPMCSEYASLLYKSTLACDIHIVSSASVAEMSKILENTYRNVNIGLINEFAIICNNMGISIWEVIEAAKTKPFGFQAFYPGPGIGGHCIPLDPIYLSWKARDYNMNMTLIEASNAVLERMPEYVVARSSIILNYVSKTIRSSKILLVGMAYKENVSDYRESPSLVIKDHLKRSGAIVNYYDPYIPFISEFEKSIELTSENIKEYDLVIIVTGHSNVDYSIIVQNAGLIFDTRNILKGMQGNIIAL